MFLVVDREPPCSSSQHQVQVCIPKCASEHPLVYKLCFPMCASVPVCKLCIPKCASECASVHPHPNPLPILFHRPATLPTQHDAIIDTMQRDTVLCWFWLLPTNALKRLVEQKLQSNRGPAPLLTVIACCQTLS